MKDESIYPLPISIPRENTAYEDAVIALFNDIHNNKKVMHVYKIRQLVKLIKDKSYSEGFRDGSRVKDI